MLGTGNRDGGKSKQKRACPHGAYHLAKKQIKIKKRESGRVKGEGGAQRVPWTRVRQWISPQPPGSPRLEGNTISHLLANLQCFPCFLMLRPGRNLPCDRVFCILRIAADSIGHGGQGDTLILGLLEFMICLRRWNQYSSNRQNGNKEVSLKVAQTRGQCQLYTWTSLDAKCVGHKINAWESKGENTGL